jgi:uncharacterized protein (DUF736 family)
MKIKEVSAGVKVSKNYNSYSVNLVANVGENESYERVGEILIDKSLDLINKKIGSVREVKDVNKEIEVGAAWYSRDSPGKLSVQYSKSGVFSEVDIKDLEKRGFVQKINNQKYIFKRIPLEKRKSNKMPVFRIYKESENE